MKSRKSFWYATLAVAAVGLVAGATIADHVIHKPVQYAEAQWKQVFESPVGLARGVDAVVLAQAVEVSAGRIATSDKGEGPLPFQLVDFDVLHGLKGVTTGERITVERAGGPGVLIDADGGEFVPGQAYLLFLAKQEGTGLYVQVNHQGRFHLAKDHFLAVDPDDPVATRFHGASLEQGLALAQAAIQGPRDRSPFVK